MRELFDVHDLLATVSVVCGQPYCSIGGLLAVRLFFQNPNAEKESSAIPSDRRHRGGLTVAYGSFLSDAPPNCALLQTTLRIRCNTTLPVQVDLPLLWSICIEQDASRK